jgi:hypothetical protein
MGETRSRAFKTMQKMIPPRVLQRLSGPIIVKEAMDTGDGNT